METHQNDQILTNLMTEYGTSVLHLAFSYVRNKETAEDLTQEIFLKCYEKLHTFNGASAIQTWLFRIAVNHCKDYLKSWQYRKVKVTGYFSTFFVSKEDTPETSIIKKSNNEEIFDSVWSLPVKYREIIYLYYFQELSQKQISEICGLNLNTVKSRLSRAKALLKKSFSERSPESGKSIEGNNLSN